MPRYARHLAEHTIVNPFPGIVKLERRLGHAVPVRIGSNEGLAEPRSPLEAAFGPALAELARLYPDPYALTLRERLAALNHCQPEEIIVDAGADSLILLALRLCVNPGDTVVCTAGSYPTFRYFAEGVGAQLREIPYQAHAGGLRPDWQALVEAANAEQAALLYLANPDNPTGHLWSGEVVAQLRAALNPDTLLLLDEAYLDFAEPSERPADGPLPGVLRLRTLSKAYALAGARVGYALADAALIDKADQIRPQFAVSSWAQAAAHTVLADPDYAPALRAHTLALREALAEALRARGRQPFASATNFVCVACADRAEAEGIQMRLLAAGVALHRPPHPAVGHLLRITAHPAALSEDVLAVLKKP